MEAKESILARMYVVLTLLCLAPVLIVFQILRIHLAEGKELRAQGKRQASSFVTIPAVRGAILDRAGHMLAVNTARYDLALDPTVAGFRQVEHTFFERLSELTDVSANAYRRRVDRRASPQYVKLRRGLTERQKEAVDSWKIPGLILDPTFERRYNYGSTAAHVVGYVTADGTGLAGLELQYDEYLSGTPGRQAVKLDRLRQIKAYVEGQVIEPEHGESLILTVDLLRQTILEEELARGVAETQAKSGAAVALDPYTGAVIAMANVPTYDPNRPGAYSAEARRNRVITDRLEPGSTFKLVTTIAAVEQDVVEMEDTIDTGDGWIVIEGRTLRDTHAHGRIPFREVISQSSNVGTAKIAMQLDPGVFYQYARNFGFGQPTWVDLPGEVAGKLKRPSTWSGTSLTSMSIGYEVDVTPLQLAVAYAALANGGLLVQPYVVAERRDVTGRTTWTARQDSVRRAFRRGTAFEILPAFEDVVDEGTATLAQLQALPVAGKTGTALKVANGRYQPGAYRASFVGFFPADDPEVVVAIVLDEPQTSRYGGSAAGPVFQRTAERWIPTYPALAQRVAPPEELPEDRVFRVPDVGGLPRHVAERRLRASGYSPRTVVGDKSANPVRAQEPVPGTRTQPLMTVRLTAADSTDSDTMRDLRGWSARDAVFWLRSRSLEPEIRGEGVVTDQMPPPGHPIDEQVVLQCR